MPVVHPICCGLDVHQARLTACLRHVNDAGQVTTAWREFGTLYAELLALSDWLVAQHCPIVAMESTGVYWKPLYHVLVGVVEVLVAMPARCGLGPAIRPIRLMHGGLRSS